jgi:hypothetical protein
MGCALRRATHYAGQHGRAGAHGHAVECSHGRISLQTSRAMRRCREAAGASKGASNGDE